MITRTKQIAYLALMLALVIVLSIFEHGLPALPFLPPGVRLGLGNVVVMYCLFFIGKPQAVLLNVLKSAFALITRGAVAGLLSFCGGMLSVCVIILLSLLSKERLSYAVLSVSGALAHNFGQFAAAYLLLQTPYFMYYAPVLAVSGVVCGLLTAVLLRAAIPALGRATGKREVRESEVHSSEKP